MSENIQSIANGTYTIGNTNNLTFQAGPGITIDSPSAGTVRIGNDETVLWEGLLKSDNIDAPSAAILSETIENFKYVQVEGFCHNLSPFPWVTKLPTKGFAIYGVGLNQWKDVTKELDCSRFKLESNGVTAMEATWIIPSNNWGNTVSYITKVIGINRKEV